MPRTFFTQNFLVLALEAMAAMGTAMPKAPHMIILEMGWGARKREAPRRRRTAEEARRPFPNMAL